MANWGRITLLNMDYKIYSNAITLWLQGVMGPLIHHNQTGLMRGRAIEDSVRLIEDSLRKIQVEHPDSKIVSLDFKKAFDSVHWNLITEALYWFNFGENFCDYIRIIWQDLESSLTNSGFTLHFFSPGRGIRQGCCASPTSSFWS